jgi:hypothetical protein
VKETNCSPFISRVFPITPYGFTEVTPTSPGDMPGYIIDALEPVSKIRRLAIPSISTEIVGAPSSNRTETKERFESVVKGGEVKEAVFVCTCFSFPDS